MIAPAAKSGNAPGERPPPRPPPLIGGLIVSVCSDGVAAGFPSRCAVLLFCSADESGLPGRGPAAPPPPGRRKDERAGGASYAASASPRSTAAAPKMPKKERGTPTPKKKKDGPKHSLDPGSRPKGGAGGMRSEATVCTVCISCLAVWPAAGVVESLQCSCRPGHSPRTRPAASRDIA